MQANYGFIYCTNYKIGHTTHIIVINQMVKIEIIFIIYNYTEKKKNDKHDI